MYKLDKYLLLIFLIIDLVFFEFKAGHVTKKLFNK